MCTYLVPLKSAEADGIDELARYLAGIATRAEVIVVDGSEPQVFERHANRLNGIARHMPVDPVRVTPMGKVGGVVSGVEAASHERVVIADDDVRYEPEVLARTAELLDDAELVRPQNYFDDSSGLPWHAHWDTARTLINRAVGRDFPGTLAVRRSFFREIGGYDGGSLFENLELIRTVEANGGRVRSPLGLYVARRPPSTSHFLSQRVRQAYDDFALPVRLAAFLAIAPAFALTLVASRRRRLAAGALAAIGLAEVGRRRAGGASRFPISASLLAPGWVAERAICAWVAVGYRLGGGVPYAGGRLARSASSPAQLRALRAGRTKPR